MIQPTILRFPVLHIFLVALAVASGCQQQPTTPPAPVAPKPAEVVGATDDGTHFTLLAWTEGLRVLVVDNYGADGWRTTISSRDSGQPYFRGGSFGDKNPLPGGTDTVGEWSVTTLDGVRGEFKINDQPFDVEDQATFLLIVESGTVEVRQIQTSLTDLQLTEDDCTQLVTKMVADASIDKSPKQPADAE